MPFNSELPDWKKDNPDPTPTQEKKDRGWVAGERPPASMWNWFANRTYTALKQLFDNAIHKETLGKPGGPAKLDENGKLITGQENTQQISDASTTQKGIVQLSDATDSTSKSLAATANALNAVRLLISNVANYAVATAAEAKAGLVNNKYMTPLRTKEAIADLAPKPIILSPGPTLITDNVAVPGASLANGVTSGDIVRWQTQLGGSVRVYWKISSNVSSATEFVHSWVEVNGTRQGEEKVSATQNLNNIQFTQEITINPGDRIAIRYRQTATTPRVLGIPDTYIGAIMNKFVREV